MPIILDSTAPGRFFPVWTDDSVLCWTVLGTFVSWFSDNKADHSFLNILRLSLPYFSKNNIPKLTTSKKHNFQVSFYDFALLGSHLGPLPLPLHCVIIE